MTVECIEDFDWDSYEYDLIKAIRTVGDELPAKGGVYEVIGFALSDNGYEGYELEGFQFEAYSHFKSRLVFNKKKFKVIDDSFKPNTWSDQFNSAVMTFNMYYRFSSPIKDNNEQA